MSDLAFANRNPLAPKAFRTHEQMNLLLGVFAGGNVLDHGYEIVDRSVAFAHAADS
jgi:hypothetical protein